MTLDTAPCEWPVLQCGPLPEEGCKDYDSLKAAASEVLWALSGRQFGCCPATLRVCRGAPAPGPGRFWYATLDSGQWYNVTCGACREDSCCCDVPQVYLDMTVCEIVEVTVGGEAVPTGSYRVDDGHWLVRTDGGRWPCCDEFTVALETGVPVPPAGQRALGELMSELWLACSDKDCKLPKRIQTLSKQGFTMAVLDPMDFLTEGKTGLYFTDLWLQSCNPQYRPSGARAMSPDWPPSRVTTWP